MEDSAITSDQFMESCDQETKTVPTDFNEKEAPCKMQNLYILLAFLLLTMALRAAVSIYYYLIKYRAKQKHFLPLHITNNK